MITDVREFVLNHFKKYSVTNTDEELLPIIVKDFTNNDNTVILHNNHFEVGPYVTVHNNDIYPYLFIHTDRVPLSNKPRTIVTETTITSQLDNLISVAVAKYLFDSDYGYNYIFTTREECGRSAPQIEEYLDTLKNAKRLQFIDLDIDQIYELDEVPNGEITLRINDRFGKLNVMLVEKLKVMSKKYDVPFLSIEANNNRQVYSQSGMLSKYTEYKSAFLGMPITNLHTGEEVMKWGVLENAIKLLSVFYMEKQDFRLTKEEVKEIYGFNCV